MNLALAILGAFLTGVGFEQSRAARVLRRRQRRNATALSVARDQAKRDALARTVQPPPNPLERWPLPRLSGGKR